MNQSNPDLPPRGDSLVERAYLDAIRAMSGPQRVERAVGLLDFVVEMLRHQIRLANPNLEEREVRFRAAERLYQSDPETLRLIELGRRQ